MFAVNPHKDWLLQLSNLFGEKEIVRFGNEVYSANDLLVERNVTCSLLKENNIIQSNSVAIIEQNSIEFVIELFSIWAIGAVPVPINLRLSEKEIIEQLKFVDAKLVFTSLEKSKIPNIFTDFNVIQSRRVNNPDLTAEYLSWNIEPTSKALLMFTSGSSGIPKCVELTFNNIISSAESVISFVNPAINDCWLASLPFYHIGGFSIIIRSILSGSVLSIPKFNTFENIATKIQKGEESYISLVPTTLQRLLEAEIIPHKSIKTIFLGGGRVSLDLVNNARKRGYKLTSVYGSTETASMVAADKLVGRKNITTSFAGKPLNGVEYFIVDENGNNLPEKQIGEIAIKASTIANGYYNNSKETNLKFKCNKTDNFNYYLTSDIGKIDEFGCLHIIGRKDDIVISGGENISAIEITDKINLLIEVIDAYAFGIPDVQWGERLVAAVVVKENEITTVAEIKNKLRNLLPSYKVPKEIFIIQNIPRTALGKIMKDKLLSVLNLKM